MAARSLTAKGEEQEMDAGAALDLLDRDASVAVFDVRRHRGKYQLRGAVFYRYDHFVETNDLALPVARDQVVLVYADDDDATGRVVERLRGCGFERAEAIDGGLKGLEDAGARLEETTQEQPIPSNPNAGIPLL
jgi:hypothetical protein